VRKFAKIALVVCLTVLSVPAALYSFVWLWVWYKTAEVDSFYQEHRLLGEMRAGEKESTNNSAPAREALLKIVPLGTDGETALAVLHNERLDCRGNAGPINGQTMSPNVLGYKQWILDLEFDADDRLSNARVAIWNIFL
jgi:hypothetical protein